MMKVVLAIFVAMSLFANGEELQVDNTKIRKAYKLGAFHIISELNRNIEQQGYEKSTIKLKKYIVAMKLTADMSTVDMLLLQRMAYSEGLTPIFTKGNFIFDSFDKKADAKYLQNDILKKSYFRNEPKSIIIIENLNNKDFEKQAFLYKKLYTKIENEIKSKYKGNVVIIEDSMKVEEVKKPIVAKNTPPKPKKPKKKAKKHERVTPPTKHFKIKSSLKEIVFYKNKKGVVTVRYTHNIADMIEAKRIPNKNLKYSYKNVATTDVGTKFIKVLNQPYFVDIQDVEIVD